MTKDRYYIKQALQKQYGTNLPDSFEQLEEKIKRKITHSHILYQQRQTLVPNIHYDQNLPVAAKADDIVAAIKKHQVIIVAGETGSGKTTQLPKMCLQAGLGVAGMIGHTQPRRLAARSVAERISDELDVAVGEQVGFQVRFTDESNEKTLIKLMTDGILLAEIQQDKYLQKYQAIIIDEAHERSLNIDFLLGYLKRILPARPDLKVIVTSATIDVERFSKHFNNAPVFEVSGRTYPVEIRYQPLLLKTESEALDSDQSMEQGILDAVHFIVQEEKQRGFTGAGDILVFLPGEREIRETADLLRKEQFRNTEVLPLYARLSAGEQQKIFKSHHGRRIVLSTNVAETSLTVPGIRYVIDPGLARISRYSVRSKVQQLPIEKISQASANQRAGRCGRVADGICIRLYDEEDFNRRPEFTDPEIFRTNLASVILQMANLRLGAVEKFSFVEMPDQKLINDGYRFLRELGALKKDKLTPIGKKLIKLPIDPKLGRMIIAADKLGVLEEVSVIVSALSIQDPRERPQDKKTQSDQAHAVDKDTDSDFVVLYNLWQRYEEQRLTLSQNQLRQFCRKQFLSFIRMREWRDIHRQILIACKSLGMTAKHAFDKETLSNKGQVTSTSEKDSSEKDKAQKISRASTQEADKERNSIDYERVHRALLSGLYTQVANKADDNKEFLVCRSRKMHLFPGSMLFKKPPKWVMTAEMVETSKLYGRVNAKIDPLWVEDYATDFLKRQYFEPHWEKKQGRVVAYEQVSLYGLVLVPKRRIDYSKVDPVEARNVFIRSALVEGEMQTKAPFLRMNQEVIESIETDEAKLRVRDILVDDEIIFQFYQSRIPAEISNQKSLEFWLKKQPDALLLKREDLIKQEVNIDDAIFPDSFPLNGVKLPLQYQFDPSKEKDGATLNVPVGLLRQLSEEELSWAVPGYIKEKCEAYLRGLPKTLRRRFVPIPQFVERIYPNLSSQKGDLLSQLSLQIKRETLIDIPLSQWLDIKLEGYLNLNIDVISDQGKVLGSGKDIHALQQRFAQQVDESFAKFNPQDEEETEFTAWPESDLPEQQELTQAGIKVLAYPALESNGKAVIIKMFDDKSTAQEAHRKGVITLLRLHLHKDVKYLQKNMPKLQESMLIFAPLGSKDVLVADLLDAVLEKVFLEGNRLPRSKAAFEQLIMQHRSQLVAKANDMALQLHKILTSYQQVAKVIKGNVSLAWTRVYGDIKLQLSNLVYPGFISQTPLFWFSQLPRYFKGIEIRLTKFQNNLNKENAYVSELEQLWLSYQQQLQAHESKKMYDEALVKYRWLLEEYRISLFAQTVGTLEPISAKRLTKQWQLVKKIV
ncbi:ATP-dependent RNA helicase HrpA [Marinomonas agarivorans]|nr:ATP-dependent RNA helicase HrpA [Marinomonas agarivorans]